MKTVIRPIANSVHHCFGCLDDSKSVESKLFEFLFSRPANSKNKQRYGGPVRCMKVLRAYFLVVVVFVFSACNIDEKSTNQDKNSKLDTSQILLVNGKNASRCELAKVFNLLAGCHPAVIGVNFVFKGKKNRFCDSLLVSSVASSNPVLLTESFDGKLLSKSFNELIEVAHSSSFTGIDLGSDGPSLYSTMTDINGGWYLTFPILVALEDIGRNDSLLSTKLFRDPKTINLRFVENDFVVCPYDSLAAIPCDSIRSKIVLIGYLGPDQFDLVNVKKGNQIATCYATLALANIILELIEK